MDRYPTLEDKPLIMTALDRFVVGLIPGVSLYSGERTRSMRKHNYTTNPRDFKMSADEEPTTYQECVKNIFGRYQNARKAICEEIQEAVVKRVQRPSSNRINTRIDISIPVCNFNSAGISEPTDVHATLTIEIDEQKYVYSIEEPLGENCIENLAKSYEILLEKTIEDKKNSEIFAHLKSWYDCFKRQPSMSITQNPNNPHEFTMNCTTEQFDAMLAGRIPK
jgi:hypothetical protein